MEACGCGLASVDLAPDGHGTIDAEGRQPTRREGGPCIRALAIGALQREGLCLGQLRLAPATAGGGINVPRATLHAKPWSGPDRTGRAEPPGAKGVAAIEPTPRGLVVPGLRGDGLPPKQRRVVRGEALFQAVQRPAATERLHHHGQHDRPGIHPPRWRHGVLEQADAAQVVGVGLANGQMVDGVPLDSGW